jgi:hypothetical protein
VASG